MNTDLIARLMASGAPSDLIAEIVMELARAQADRDVLAQRRSTERANSARYRSRGGGEIPGWLRRQVFERDDYICVDCGAEDRLECDHVLPLMAGGETTFDNLQTLCKPCNARKRDRVRKADHRGQTRNRSDNATVARTSADVQNPTPILDKESVPQTPFKEINPTPNTHTAPARGATIFVCPEGVDPQHWSDFLANRKRKNLANTETAYAGQLKLIDQFADDEWPPGKLVQLAAEKGWATIVNPRESEHRNGHGRLAQRETGTPGIGRTEAAGIDAKARLRAAMEHSADQRS